MTQADVIVRFNDMNNLYFFERTDLHVVRHPSWYSWTRVNAPTWDIAWKASDVPSRSLLHTYIYESQHGASNAASVDSRLFPSCNCGPSCLHSQTWAGPSTGAIVISELQSSPEVQQIDVFGFNSMGDKTAHIDFKNSSILRNCCTKCTFHETASSHSYGNDTAIFVLVGTGVVFVVCLLLFCACAEKSALWTYRSIVGTRERETRRPLVALDA